MGKIAGALLVTDSKWQLSLTIGKPKFIPVALHPELVPIIFVDGQIIDGLIVSLMVTN